MSSNMQPKIWIWLKRRLSNLFFMLYLKVLGQTEEQYWNVIREYMAVTDAAQRWIPVSEKPKVDGRYLLRNIYDDIYPAKFVAESESWILGRYDNITHWMPLPESPIVYGKVCEE